MRDVGFWTQSNGRGAFVARSFGGTGAGDKEVEGFDKMGRKVREAIDAFGKRTGGRQPQ
jgi:hypothetical protein